MPDVKMKNVRIAFCQSLFIPEKFDENDPKSKAEHAATFLFPPDHPDLPKLKEAQRAAAVEKWGQKADEILKQLAAQDRLVIHDGNLKSQFDGYEGNFYINSRNTMRPAIKDVDGKRNLMPQDGKPYGGCYVTALVSIWAQDNKFGKRINASLMGVQFLRDGDSFGGARVASDDAFDDCSAEYEGPDAFGDDASSLI